MATTRRVLGRVTCRGSAAAGALALLWATAGAVHAEVCVGDCTGDETVAINELITCVNIALGNADVSSCLACDANDDGEVTINELITAVNNALAGCEPAATPTVTPTAGPTATATGFCGNGVVDVAGEDCDNGGTCVGGTNELATCSSAEECPGGECRPVGGDSCAVNCTREVVHFGTLRYPRSNSVVQAFFVPLNLEINGDQSLIMGGAREDVVKGPGGEVLSEPGQVPVVSRARLLFEPIVVHGLACACVRNIERPEFGPGNGGVGFLACGEDGNTGLTDINYRVFKDHNTNPGDPGNSGPEVGLPDDPECDNTFEVLGVRLEACREGEGAECSGEGNEHPGICNSPAVYEFYGGPAPRGSILLAANTATAILGDFGACDETGITPQRPVCPAELVDYGPDCLPCTDDDLEQGIPSLTVNTTGTVETILYDGSNVAGKTMSRDSNNCSPAGAVCNVVGAGRPDDCDRLQSDEDAPLGGALVSATIAIDTASIGDNSKVTTLDSE